MIADTYSSENARQMEVFCKQRCFISIEFKRGAADLVLDHHYSARRS